MLVDKKTEKGNKAKKGKCKQTTRANKSWYILQTFSLTFLPLSVRIKMSSTTKQPTTGASSSNASTREEVASKVLTWLSVAERVALLNRLNDRTDVEFSNYLIEILNERKEAAEQLKFNTSLTTGLVPQFEQSFAHPDMSMLKEIFNRFPKDGVEDVLDHLKHKWDGVSDVCEHLKALKRAFRRFYKVEIPQEGLHRYALGYTVREKLREDKQVWIVILREDMSNYTRLDKAVRTHNFLLKKFEIFFEKPVPNLFRVLFYKNKGVWTYKADDEYTINSTLTSGTESFVHHCMQKHNLKTLKLLQKTFEFDMKQDGYRLPRDALIRYVLFYQLRETTMKWIRTQWANFFNRLDNESFGCPADPVEQFAVDFFRKSRAVPENAFCHEWACSISNEQRSRHDEKQRIRSKKMAPTIAWFTKRGWANTRHKTLDQFFPHCWSEIRNEDPKEASFILPGFQGEVFSLDLGRIMARFPTLKAYADKCDQLEKARVALIDPEHPLSSLVTMTTPVEKNAGYYFADLGWSVWRETVVKEKGRLPQKWKITPACLDTFLNTGGSGFGSLERLEHSVEHPEPNQKESMEWSEKICAVVNAQRKAVLEKRGFFNCPLSGEVMKDPVVASDGYSYEREALEAYMTRCAKNRVPISSPMVPGGLDRTVLYPNIALRTMADDLNKSPAEAVPVCPITQLPFAASTVPHILSSGQSFTKTKVKQWLKTSELCPMTNINVKGKPILPNFTLSVAIDALKMKKKDPLEKRVRKNKRKRSAAGASGSGASGSGASSASLGPRPRRAFTAAQLEQIDDLLGDTSDSDAANEVVDLTNE